MVFLSKRTFEAEVMYFPDFDLCKLLRVNNSKGERFFVGVDTHVTIEENPPEYDVAQSEEFLSHMREEYGLTDGEDIVVIEGDDIDDDYSAGEYQVEVCAIEDSCTFEVLRVTASDTKSSEPSNIPIDTGKVFTHPGGYRDKFPLELIEYLNGISGRNLARMKVTFNYTIKGGTEANEEQEASRLPFLATLRSVAGCNFIKSIAKIIG